MKALEWKKELTILVALLVWSSFGPIQSAVAAQSAADFYKGKTITWICPFSPGGGYDIWARVLAPAVQKLTGATVVVRNMPGGSGMVGSNYMYTKSKPDGLTIGISLAFTMVIDYLFENPAVKYDFTKFTWLGRLSTDDYVFSVGKDSPYKTLKDIKAAPVFKIGRDSRTGVNGAGVTAFAMASDLRNVRIVAGYGGTAEIKLAVITGEIDGTSSSIGSQWQNLKGGQLIPVTMVGKERAKSLPDVPTIYELNPNIPAKTKRWVDQLVQMQDTGRAVFAPPGVPDDRANFLREVIKKALQDPDVVNKLKKHQFLAMYMPAHEYKQQLESLEMSSQDRSELKHLLLEKY